MIKINGIPKYKVDNLLIDSDDEFSYTDPLPYGWDNMIIKPLDEEVVSQIKQETKSYNNKEHLCIQDDALAEKYGVSRSAIRGIRTGRTWSNIK